MSDTSVEKIKGIASYYKGTQEEILNIPVHLIDPDGIFVESNTGEMWTGIQIIKINLNKSQNKLKQAITIIKINFK